MRKMSQKFCIRVMYGEKFIGEIYRVLRGRQVGNFNPVFCTYKGKEHLVKSENCDFSDPFRRNGESLTTLYIELDKE